MRRDMELIRFILFDVEGETEVDLSAYSNEQIIYHKVLLVESGLIHGTVPADETNVYPRRLSWEGHDFLDAARNETVWKKTMVKVKELGGGVTLEIVKALLIAIAKDHFGLT